jgi:ADP-ribosylglycohydrolase
MFDVEVFSKIELPVFLSYALGAGRGTKAAAHQLSRKATRWYNPFGKDAQAYVSGGGNGAAMRIQPHVWASAVWKPEAYLPQVLRDAVCTHGHPRAIIGALLHALCLGTALHEGRIAAPDRWTSMGRYLQIAKDLPQRDEALAERWLYEWEQAAGRSWSAAADEVVAETVDQLAIAAQWSRGSDPHAYHGLALELGAFDPKTRGAGNISAVLALWVAWQGFDEPERAIRNCASMLGSDTDTIASMAGALVGAVVRSAPSGDLQDVKLLAAEATRLATLRDAASASFPHPDPLHWQPPASLSDAYGTIDGVAHVAGLGSATPIREPVQGQGKAGGLWQWVELDFGQTILIKRREQLPELSRSSLPLERRGLLTSAQASLEFDRHLPDARPQLPPRQASAARSERPRVEADNGSAALTLDSALAQVIASSFDPSTIGGLTLRLADGPDGAYQAGLFAYRISELRRSSGHAQLAT